VLVAIVAFGLFLLGQGGRTPPATTPQPSLPGPADQAGQEAEFWKIIDATTPASRGGERQLTELKGRLMQLPIDDLEKFIRVYDRLMARTYRWDLWGAAYVAQGGASDDAFEDFRKWLISQGRTGFERVSNDPDSLADAVPVGYEGDATFEEFSYLFADIWTERTGKPLTALPKDKDALYPPEPAGAPFSEDPKELAARYPKLWRRFGEEPLQ
jgi:hypothetical protein